MKIRILLLSILCIGTIRVSCQEKGEFYLRGKIIISEGDTLEGFIIDELDWQLKNQVKFTREPSKQNITTYKPNEIQGFRYDSGRVFKSIQAENDSTLVFGKVLLVGKINLIVVRIESLKGNDYYLQRSDSSLTLKISPPQKTEVIRDGQVKIVKEKTYLNLINRILNSYDDTKGLTYNEKKLVALINKINVAAELSEPPYEEKIAMKKNISVGMGILTNPNTNNLRFSGYVLRQKTERTRRVSILSGISYRYWNRERESLEWGANTGNGFIQDQIHRVNLIPVGIHIQANSRGVLFPYFYSGVGLALIVDSWRVVENFEITDNSRVTIIPGLAFENCIGLRVKLNSIFLYTELTGGILPTNIYCNLGLSF